MTPGWKSYPFEDVLVDASGGNRKTPRSEFLEAGAYPVVDQGKELVAGYVDDRSRVCTADLPVIIFGDHTRCFKYVDFPFCMGADGIKVLRPKPNADAKYLYHFLRTLPLTDGGYDRHYKYLKRTQVLLPEEGEQRRIAEVLDRAEALRTKRRAALAQLDTLTQSIFLELSAGCRTSIPTLPIGDAMEVIIDYRGKSPIKTSSGVPLVTARVVKGGRLLAPNEFIAEEAYDAWMRRGLPKQGDVLFTSEAPLGEVAQVGIQKIALAQRLLLLRGRPLLLDNTFLMYALISREVRSQIESRATGSTVRGIRQSELRKVMIPVPPLEDQQLFARRITAVEKLKSTMRASLTEFDALFASLQHRAFRGEL